MPVLLQFQSAATGGAEQCVMLVMPKRTNVSARGQSLGKCAAPDDFHEVAQGGLAVEDCGVTRQLPRRGNRQAADGADFEAHGVVRSWMAAKLAAWRTFTSMVTMARICTLPFEYAVLS